MPVMDEFKEEREKIKTASPEQKWKYFKDYYLKWVIAGGIGLAFVISFIVSIVTKKDDVLTVLLINFTPLETAEAQVEQSFTEQYVEDPKKQQIQLDTTSRIAVGEVSGNDLSSTMTYSYADEERVMALAYTGSIDLMISGEDVIRRYMEAEWFVPLDTVLDADTLAGFEAEGRVIYYADQPAAICMDTAKVLNENYYYAGEGEPSLYAAFGGGSKHADLAVQFLKFIQ